MLLTLTQFDVFAKGTKKAAKPDPRKDMMLGNLIKNALENYHYKSMVINDDVSKKAFDEYLKRVDYGKQFLLKSDIQKLEKFRSQMDDQLSNGKHTLIQLTQKILDDRVKQADKFREEFLKRNLILHRRKNWNSTLKRGNGILLKSK